MTLWRTIVAWLAALSADPAAIDTEPPRSYAAVAAAYAAFAPDAAPAPPAPPVDCPCGGSCKGTGKYRPDGRIELRCSPGCATCPRSVLVRPECESCTVPPSTLPAGARR